MPDYSPYQRKVIARYYDRKDEILIARLQEIVTDLALAESETARKRLWSRAEAALEALKAPPNERERIMSKLDSQALARYVRDLLADSNKRGGAGSGNRGR